MSQTTRPATPGPTGAGDDGSARVGRGGGSRHTRRRLLALGVGVALAAVLAVILFTGAHSSSSPSPVTVGDTAPGINASSAALLDLNVISPRAAQPAPDFQLLDQNGTLTSLSQFRGKVVVWSLNDDQCTDLCTLFAQDVVAADHDLGPAVKDVVFLSVNANPFYPSPAAVKAWSVRNDLEGTSNWVYVTGPPAQLERTWSAYKVTVVQNKKTRTVDHDAAVEFIDPTGQERALGYFAQGSISTVYYAHAMAQMAVDLLPKSEQVDVSGPSVNATSTAGATIGDPAPPFTLPNETTGQATTLGGLENKPLVINFWSTTCSICEQEMPALQQVNAAFGGRVNFAGVDVADPRGRAAAAGFGQRLGIRYPLLDDSDGSVQSAYRVSTLPVTLIVAPGGSILARHDGGLTATQLVAVLEEDFESLPQVSP